MTIVKDVVEGSRSHTPVFPGSIDSDGPFPQSTAPINTIREENEPPMSVTGPTYTRLDPNDREVIR